MFFFFAPKSHSWGWVAQISPLVPYDIDLASVSLRKNSQQTQSPSLYGAGTHGFMPGKPPRNNRHFLNQFRAHISQTKNFSPRAISRLRSGNWHSHESKFTLGVGLPSSSRIRATRKRSSFPPILQFWKPGENKREKAGNWRFYRCFFVSSSLSLCLIPGASQSHLSFRRSMANWGLIRSFSLFFVFLFFAEREKGGEARLETGIKKPRIGTAWMETFQEGS